MIRGFIRLCYTSTIDCRSAGLWEKQIWEDTYLEFRMQAQQFDQQHLHDSFSEIFLANPRADQMHYLVSTAAANYIRALNGRMPDIQGGSGMISIPFRNFSFRILESSVSDKAMHRIAIHFYSEPLPWIDSIGDHLLVSDHFNNDGWEKGDEIIVKTIILKSPLTVYTVSKSLNKTALATIL